jgi:hypothetical protein
MGDRSYMTLTCMHGSYIDCECVQNGCGQITELKIKMWVAFLINLL